MDYSAWLILITALILWTIGVIFIANPHRNKPSVSYGLICLISSLLSFMVLGVYKAPNQETALNIHYINALWPFLFVCFVYMITSINEETRFFSKWKYRYYSIIHASILFILETVFKRQIHGIELLEGGFTTTIKQHWANDFMIYYNLAFSLIIIAELVHTITLKSLNIHKRRLVAMIIGCLTLASITGMFIFSSRFVMLPMQTTLPLFYLLIFGSIGGVIYRYGFFEANSQLVTKNIIENTTNFLLVINNEGIIIESNHKLDELTALKPEQYLHEHASVIIPEINYCLEQIKKDKFYTTDYFLRKNEEYLLPVELFISPVLRGKRQIGYLIMGNDLTQHIEVQQKLEQYAKVLELHTQRLEESNEELKNFADVISHDLRSPLNTITGFIGILERKNQGNLVEGSQEYVNFIKKGAQNMTNIIDSLLHLAKYGRNQIKIENCHIKEIIENAIINLQTEINHSKATITMGKLHMIQADSVQILQLIQNLIENAIKYAKKNEAPNIHIRSKVNPKGTLIQIEDNGIGVSKEDQENIFSIFKQVRQESDGIGLGLATCKKIVENHKGEISIQSQLGIGTTFSIFIPHES